MMIDKQLRVPSPGSTDRAISVLRAAVGSTPLVGAAAVELFNALVTPPLEKRRNEWMENVASKLQALAQEGRVSLEALQQDESFLDSVMEATLAALRTSDEDKKAALNNVVMNSALPGSPDASKRKIFVGLVGDLTPWHLSILMLSHEPRAWFQERDRPVPEFAITGSLSTLLEKAFPELVGQREFYGYVWKDLYQSGLVTTDGVQTMMTASGVYESRTTDLAKEFIGFISEPRQ